MKGKEEKKESDIKRKKEKKKITLKKKEGKKRLKRKERELQHENMKGKTKGNERM